MPIEPRFPIRRLSQTEFGDLAFDVMKQVFDIHNQFGRLFDESIYKRELARRMPEVRLEAVEHEFVNAQRRRSDCDEIRVHADRWDRSIPGAKNLLEFVVAMLSDLGTGLETSLYEAAIQHFIGGQDRVEADIPVEFNGHIVGQQRMGLMAPRVAIIVSGLDHGQNSFEKQIYHLLTHTDLDAIGWINVNLTDVVFITLRR